MADPAPGRVNRNSKWAPERGRRQNLTVDRHTPPFRCLRYFTDLWLTKPDVHAVADCRWHSLAVILKGEASEERPPRNTKSTHEIGNTL